MFSSLGDCFFVDADPWKQRWFLSRFSTSNCKFDDMSSRIPLQSQNCHGLFDSLSLQYNFDGRPLKHERESTMRQSPFPALYRKLGDLPRLIRTHEFC